jgi:hypothetical protein
MATDCRWLCIGTLAAYYKHLNAFRLTLFRLQLPHAILGPTGFLPIGPLF